MAGVWAGRRERALAARRLEQGVEQAEDAIESLAATLGDALGDRLPALAEQLADRFPNVAEQIVERLGDRVPALQRYTRRRPSFFESVLSFLVALLLGAAIGAGAAFVFAPSDGKTLRARLQRKLDDLMGYTPPPQVDGRWTATPSEAGAEPVAPAEGSEGT
jgi:hypothetical protein